MRGAALELHLPNSIARALSPGWRNSSWLTDARAATCLRRRVCKTELQRGGRGRLNRERNGELPVPLTSTTNGSIQFASTHLRCPVCWFPALIMPSFRRVSALVASQNGATQPPGFSIPASSQFLEHGVPVLRALRRGELRRQFLSQTATSHLRPSLLPQTHCW